jgi:uncharacterized protein YkwD
MVTHRFPPHSSHIIAVQLRGGEEEEGVDLTRLYSVCHVISHLISHSTVGRHMGSIVRRLTKTLVYTSLLFFTSSFNTVAAILNVQDQRLVLNHVNSYRAKHQDTPVVSWNSDIERSCDQWATTLASINTLQHSSSTAYGENLFQVYVQQRSSDAHVINKGVDSWYAERSDYNYSEPGFSPSTGHFSALVWANTRQIAAAVQFSGTTAFVVMQFFPPGNYVGQFDTNVLMPWHQTSTPLPLQQLPPLHPSPLPLPPHLDSQPLAPATCQCPPPHPHQVRMPPPKFRNPPPSQKSYVSIKYLFIYDTNNDYSSATTTANNLCPALVFALLPYNATTECKPQYASTTGTYYGMEYSLDDIYRIKSHIAGRVDAFTVAAQLFCQSTVTLVVGGEVIYRLGASPTKCFPDN